jgi:predicted nuclease of predicted toxin-antitoxin system
MIYLIDNQLPPGLVGHLQTHGLNTSHVSQCGLQRASDREIWNYAKSHDCVIVSKDEDFVHLSGSDPDGPPLVWIRLGNCRNPALFAAFDTILPALLQEIASGTKVVEVR